MFVSEMLAEREVVKSQGLVASGGFLLGRVLRKLNLKRDAFRINSTLYCRPPVRQGWRERGQLSEWAERAIQHCPYMDEDIDAQQPQCIVALGEIAFHKLTNETLPISAARGYVFRERRDRCWVVPTFHPDFVGSGNQHLALPLRWDIEKALRIAREGYSHDDPSLLCDPALPKWEQWVAWALTQPGPLALDTETMFTSDLDDEEVVEEDPSFTIERYSFAVNGESAVSVPAAMPYLVGVKQLVEHFRTRMITSWNTPYDRPRVAQALELTLPLTHYRDAMNMWHVLYSALPKKIGFATACLPSSWRLRAWKHLSQLEGPYYSAMDALALWRDDQDIERLLRETGQWSVYQRTMGQLDPVLERMSQGGLLVDAEAKAALQTELDAKILELETTMQAIVPVEAKPTHVWKTLKGAEKGLPLLKAGIDPIHHHVTRPGQLAEDATWYEIPATKLVASCSACGAAPVTKSHVQRRTLPAPLVDTSAQMVIESRT